MSNAEVTHRIPIYVVDGERIDMPFKRPELIVESSGRHSDSVILVIDGHSYAVSGRDLQTAISNCMNKTR